MPTYLAYLNLPREQGNPGAGGAAEGGAGGGRLETAQEICGVSVLQGFFFPSLASQKLDFTFLNLNFFIYSW